ncbi:hypothetical protein BU17DRAFT_73971 [Hysterangium stoloniferum]|nr:hypothetical protein BU17DRAFT_73971 [Hysterangium stoloniferum]
MAPFSVSQLKESAANVKNSGTDKFQSVRAKLSSRPTGESTYIQPRESQKGPPPPPPPKRYDRQDTGADDSSKPSPSGLRPPPIVRRDTRPPADHNELPSLISRTSLAAPPVRLPSFVPPNRPAPAPKDSQEIKWSALKAGDKQVFFGWLDEYFGQDKDKIHGRPSSSVVEPPTRTVFTVVQSNITPKAATDKLELSHPPPTEYGSSALDLCMSFSSDVQWDTPWYSSDNPVPPQISGNSDCVRSHWIQWIGNQTTLTGGVLFSDLSMCWYAVEWSKLNPRDTSAARRRATYTARPEALSQDELIAAHETYGETVAAFAEGYEGTGEWCARGECWDLASEGLKSFDQWDYIPKPIPSISKTHGHLIYEGKAWGKGPNGQAGRWRGGDDRIRRGDIVQWKTTVICEQRATFSLGDPDHTAIIRWGVITPADLVQLEVVEQSVHSPPSRTTYRLEGMEKGEVWIYRPVGMEAYLKLIFSGQWPDDLVAAVEA